jgi:colicin import membrane protein
VNSDRVLIIAVPLFVAVLVHVAFLVAIEGEWNTSEATVVAKAQVVQASLVSLKAPKQSPPKPKPKPKPKSKPKPKPKPKPKTKPKSVPLEPKPVAPAPVEPPKEPIEEIIPDSLQEDRLAELQKELMAGLDELPQMTSLDQKDALDEVQQVAALMQARITQNWRRPPSARNGMEALLTISLVPTGEVVGINVATGSGSNAFDRSAIAAVERVGQFPEVAVLSISDFERYFRRFPLRFRPEDLRY